MVHCKFADKLKIYRKFFDKPNFWRVRHPLWLRPCIKAILQMSPTTKNMIVNEISSLHSITSQPRFSLYIYKTFTLHVVKNAVE